MSKGLSWMIETRRVFLGAGLCLALALGGSSAAAETDGGVGQICIAPLVQGFEMPVLSYGTDGTKETVVLVDEEAGGIDNAIVALPDRKVTVEVETRGEIVVGRAVALSLGPLSTTKRSLIKLRENGKIVQSFLFRGSPRQDEGYCLVYRAGRETWAILPLEEVGDWCSCDHRRYVAPVVPVKAEEGE